MLSNIMLQCVVLEITSFQTKTELNIIVIEMNINYARLAAHAASGASDNKLGVKFTNIWHQ